MPWPTAVMKWPISAPYGGTDAFLKQTFSRAGIKITAYESDQALLANIRPATKVVLFETLTNPTLKVVDPRWWWRRPARWVPSRCVTTPSSPPSAAPARAWHRHRHAQRHQVSGRSRRHHRRVVAGRHELMKSIRTVALKHIGSPIGPQEAYLLQRGSRPFPCAWMPTCTTPRRWPSSWMPTRR